MKPCLDSSETPVLFLLSPWENNFFQVKLLVSELECVTEQSTWDAGKGENCLATSHPTHGLLSPGTSLA